MKRITFIVLAGVAFSCALLAAPLSAQFVYVANWGDNTISAYSLNPKTGVLIAVSGSPFAFGAGPFYLALHPSSRFLYVRNANANTVSGYRIDDETGALTAIPGSLFEAGLGANSVAIDPSAQFAYVTNENDNTVSAYIIDCDGYLLPVAGSPFPTGHFPADIAVTR